MATLRKLIEGFERDRGETVEAVAVGAHYDPMNHERMPSVAPVGRDEAMASARMCQTCGEEAILRHSPGEGYHIYATLCDEHRGDYVPAAADPIVMSLKVSPDGKVHEVKRR